VVHPALPVRSVKELIALAKAHPGKLDYSSPGIGAVFHMSGELFKLGAGVDIVHVPYKGASPALAGVIAVADTLKEHAAETVRALKSMGIEVLMLTGDNRRTAEAIAREAGVDRVISEVLPAQKVDKIKELQGQGNVVAMVGDGINDAPALAAADVGVALGSGTDIAMETGGIVLIKDDLRDVVAAIQLSRRTVRKIRQNLFWAFFYNTALIPVAAGILAVGLIPGVNIVLNPIIAGAAMGFSSVSVVMNSMTLRRFKPRI